MPLAEENRRIRRVNSTKILLYSTRAPNFGSPELRLSNIVSRRQTPRTADIKDTGKAGTAQPGRKKPAILSIRDIMKLKRKGASTQGRSEHNQSQSQVVKTECNNQFSFGERSSNDENGSVNMNKLDDAIQDLNDKDRKINLRNSMTPGPHDSKEAGGLALRRQKSDMDQEKKD